MSVLADLAWPPPEVEADEEWASLTVVGGGPVRAGFTRSEWARAEQARVERTQAERARLHAELEEWSHEWGPTEETWTNPAERRRQRRPGLRRGWPVAEPLVPLLPGGLRGGSVLAVGGSASLLLALLGAASEAEALIALVGLPALGADAMAEHGIDLTRTAVIPDAGSTWMTTLGALLDTVDIVVTRPAPRMRPGAVDVQRLAARARKHESVLLAYLPDPAQWPNADTRLRAEAGPWEGVGDNGCGRLRRRQVTVSASGRGGGAGERAQTLWLPGADGRIAVAPPLASVTTLHPRAG